MYHIGNKCKISKTFKKNSHWTINMAQYMPPNSYFPMLLLKKKSIKYIPTQLISLAINKHK